MFEDIPDVELDFEDRDREIVLMDREYLIEIMKLIANTPPYVIGMLIILLIDRFKLLILLMVSKVGAVLTYVMNSSIQ